MAIWSNYTAGHEYYAVRYERKSDRDRPAACPYPCPPAARLAIRSCRRGRAPAPAAAPAAAAPEPNPSEPMSVRLMSQVLYAIFGVPLLILRQQEVNGFCLWHTVPTPENIYA